RRRPPLAAAGAFVDPAPAGAGEPFLLVFFVVFLAIGAALHCRGERWTHSVRQPRARGRRGSDVEVPVTPPPSPLPRPLPRPEQSRGLHHDRCRTRPTPLR